MSDGQESARLRLFVGGRPVEYRLDRPVRVGADPHCEVSAPDAGLESVHLLLAPEGARTAYIEDRSSEGVRLNGEPLRGRRRLVNGDEVTLGTARLVFLAGEGAGGGAGATPPESVSRTVDVGLGRGLFDQVGAADPTACAVCHTFLTAGESGRRCANCGRSHHDDCWTSGGNCGACGARALEERGACPTPEASKPSPRASAAEAAPVRAAPASASEYWPWEHAWLGSAVIAGLLSPATWGWTSLLAGVFGLWRWRRACREQAAWGPVRSPERSAVRAPLVAWSALAVSGLGLLAGAAVSLLLDLR